MRAFQSIISEAFHKEQAWRMYPPAKIKERLIVNPQRGDQSYINNILRMNGVIEKTAAEAITVANDYGVFMLVFNTIKEADPTPEKKYAPWIMRVWMNRGFGLEDSGRMTMSLDWFDQAKKNGSLIRARKAITPIGAGDFAPWFQKFLDSNFDINALANLGHLEVVIQKFKTIIDNDPKVRLSRQQAADAKNQEFYDSNQAKLVLDTSECRIVLIKSQAAACHFGVNTQWCTAATKGHNAYENYDGTGELYVILDKPRNKRWQIFFPFDSDSRGWEDDEEEADYSDPETPAYQFMDENDREASVTALPDEAFAYFHKAIFAEHERSSVIDNKAIALQKRLFGLKDKWAYEIVHSFMQNIGNSDIGEAGHFGFSMSPALLVLGMQNMTQEARVILQKYDPEGWKRLLWNLQFCVLVEGNAIADVIADINTFENGGKTPTEVTLPYIKVNGAYREINGIQATVAGNLESFRRINVADIRDQLVGIYCYVPYERTSVPQDMETNSNFYDFGLGYHRVYNTLSEKTPLTRNVKTAFYEVVGKDLKQVSQP